MTDWWLGGTFIGSPPWTIAGYTGKFFSEQLQPRSLLRVSEPTTVQVITSGRLMSFHSFSRRHLMQRLSTVRRRWGHRTLKPDLSGG